MITLSGFIDTHAHLDWFLENGNLQEVLDESRVRNVNSWIIPGVKPDNWKRIGSVCNTVENSFPAYGVHPLHADEWTKTRADELAALSKNSCGIGEIGLDYYPFAPGPKIQMKAFMDQMDMAASLKKPVIIHCRRAFQDTLDTLNIYRSKTRGVIHAFSGSYETASRCIDSGFMIGIAGSVTFQNARKLPELLPRLPLDSILIETDSPDIAPYPHIKEINTPSNLTLIAKKAAELMNVTADDLMLATTSNAANLFGLDSIYA